VIKFRKFKVSLSVFVYVHMYLCVCACVHMCYYFVVLSSYYIAQETFLHRIS
jgi:hypothetical protein